MKKHHLMFFKAHSDIFKAIYKHFQEYYTIKIRRGDITVLSYITLSQMLKQHLINCSSKYYQGSHDKMFYEVVWISQHQEKIHIMNLDHLFGMFFSIQSRRVRCCFSFFKSVIGDLNILWTSQLVLVVKNLSTSAGV